MNIFPTISSANTTEASATDTGTGIGTGIGSGLENAFSFELALRELEAISNESEQPLDSDIAASTEESSPIALAQSILAGFSTEKQTLVEEVEHQPSSETPGVELSIDDQSDIVVPQHALAIQQETPVDLNLEGQLVDVPESATVDSKPETEVGSLLNQQTETSSNQSSLAGNNPEGNPHQGSAQQVFEPETDTVETDASESNGSIPQEISLVSQQAEADANLGVSTQAADTLGVAPATVESAQEVAQTIAPAVPIETATDSQSGLVAAQSFNETVQTPTTDSSTAAIAESSLGPRTAAQSVSSQVTQAVQATFTSFTNEPKQSIQVSLHPPELGQLQITVEQTSDQMVAQIMATEFNSTELLLQEKDFLMEKLSDLGFGEMSLDISHGQSDQHEQSGNGRSNSSAQQDASAQPIEDTVNMQIQTQSRGVNFVA